MTEPLSTTELDAIRARADAATPGPWSARNRSSDGIEDAFLGFEIDGPPDATRGQFARRADAEFMAHARTDIPALLEHIEQQDAEIAALTAKNRELYGLLKYAADDTLLEERPAHNLRYTTQGDTKPPEDTD